jgi:hypothetical protein
MSTDEKIIKQLESRIERLEREVFGSGKKPVKKQGAAPGFKGATGGIRLLISKNFFVEKRAFGEVRKALEKNGYHYTPQAVQMALTGLSARKGPLVALKKKGKKLYVVTK